MSLDCLKVVHVITSLTQGGAETVLYKTIVEALRQGWDVSNIRVVSLTSGGIYYQRLQDLGVQVVELNMKSPFRFVLQVYSLVKSLRRWRPTVIHAWMYHANLFASIVRCFCPGASLIWSVRTSLSSYQDQKTLTRWVVKCGAKLSSYPSAIIYNSVTSREQHEQFGYCKEKSVILYNGFEAAKFKPNKQIYDQFRKEQGLSVDTQLVGLFARFHQVKNHKGFLEMAVYLKKRYKAKPLKFILAGAGCDHSNNMLNQWINDLGLRQDVILLSSVEASDYMPILNVLVSCSWNESFSNVIGESLLCGVPCVITNVGDAKIIVQNHGIVVESFSSLDLAEATLCLLQLSEVEKQQMAVSARQSMVDRFSSERAYDCCQDIYHSVIES